MPLGPSMSLILLMCCVCVHTEGLVVELSQHELLGCFAASSLAPENGNNGSDDVGRIPYKDKGKWTAIDDSSSSEEETPKECRSQSPEPEPEVEPGSSKELNKQKEELSDENIELLNKLEKIREDTILRHFYKLKEESKISRELNKVNYDIKIIVITLAQQLI